MTSQREHDVDYASNLEVERSPQTVKVVIAGINGRMGKASARALLEDPQFELVGAYGKHSAPYVGTAVNELVGLHRSSKAGILVSNGFSEAASNCIPDVLLDFTKAEIAIENARHALSHECRFVSGTSGISPEQLQELDDLATKHKLGAMIVPNFSIGAVLMMEFAKQAARFFEQTEIVEIHHTGKVDAPSGTAMHTVRKMASVREEFNPPVVKEKELIVGARGGRSESGIRVHSLRLPGVLSHQDVIFGSAGEMLTIRHESFNTDCFVNGILLALKAVLSINHLVLGLENVMMQEPVTT